MGLFSRKPPLFIGLDIKSNVVRFVELASRNPLVVKSYGERALPASIIRNGKIRNERTLEEVLEEMFENYRISKKGMVYTALNQTVVIRKTLVPDDMKIEAIREHLFLEIGDSIQLPFEQPVFDIMAEDLNVKKRGRGRDRKKGRSSSQREIHVVATPSESLNVIAKTLKEVNQVPVAVDLSALAYQRLETSRRRRRSRSAQMILEVDCGSATFTIFEENVPVYTQYEDYNPNHWVPAPSSEEEVDWLIEKDVKKIKWDEVMTEENQVEWMYDETVERQALERLAETANNVMYFYSSSVNPNRSVGNIVLAGDNPLLKTVVRSVMREHLDVPTEVLNVSFRDSKGPKLDNKYYLALGLAMKEV